MRKYLFAAIASAAIASPAAARDGSPYVGIEAGVAMSDEGFFDVDFDGNEYHSGLNVNYKLGMDADVVAGFDLGMFRLEAELGYKRLGIKKVDASGPLLGAISAFVGAPVLNDDLDLNDRVSVLSLMGNALLDFGGDTGIGAYVGGGFGRARTKMFGDRDGSWAWQGIAGVRAPVTPQIDLGLKYRYFNSGKLTFEEQFNAGDPFAVAANGRFKSHSLLASLIYNFAAPPPPPPPPPPAPPPPPPPPATQTCPDGSVILATDVCPAPPPPPPPPPPAPERG